MRTKNLVALSLVVALGLVARPASANLIANGSFESPIVTSDVGLGNDNGVLLSNWISTTTDNSAGFTQNYLFGATTSGFSDKVSNGNQAVLFNGDGAQTLTLSQTFATTPGNPYRVSFDLSRQTQADDPAQILFTAQATGSSVENFLTPGGAAANGYVSESFQFIATGSSTTLTFTSPTYSGSSNSPELDNVVVTALPEPSSNVALVGLAATVGLIAFRSRRRKA